MALSKPQTLTTIFSDVLANLAFMFTDDEPTDSPIGETWLETTIAYYGPATGTLRFRCTRSFTVLLAANLLGIDVDDDGAARQGDDAVKEFMNIVCGQFVTARYGCSDVYNLSIPRIIPMDQTPDFGEDDGTNSSTLSVDNHTVQLIYEPGANADEQ